ncbi:hypothetical protein [Alteribacter natronophilus]|uniref:hypothetical protein n=1 Tax=Alteribacter natronophilus TaxID=2583810 RepID=UPI00110D8328|nr:hypothetical protein [Alteribacter natronophilus]TMW70524.1 hypothetical protein FGB90_15140 [Alteribacter natronophilus]
MKRFFTYMLVLGAGVLASGCSEDTSGSEPDFEGKLVPGHQAGNMVTVFVEDSVDGTDYDLSHIRSGRHDVLEDYEVEAYRVLMDDDTVIAFADSDREIPLNGQDLLTYSSWLFTMGQDASISVREDFEPVVSTHLDSRSPYYWSLIPILTADVIEVEPLDLDTLIGTVTHIPHHEDETYVNILSFTEDSLYGNAAQEIQTRTYEYSDRNQHVMYIQAAGKENLAFFDHMFEEFPKYVVIKNGEKLYESEDIEDIFRFIEDDLGLEKNNEF